MRITVVGQGYVGLPLSIAAAESGYIVFGLDNNEKKIQLLSQGKSTIEDLTDAAIKKSIISKNYIPTTSQEVIAESQVILICVPTPLSASHQPDLSALINATITVGQNLKKGALVIVESTIEPGTCRNVLWPIILKESGLKSNDLEFAYSPERIDPTNVKWGIRNTPKLVAGLTEITSNRAKLFYEKFIDSITICSSLEIAETAKLLENSFMIFLLLFFLKVGYLNSFFAKKFIEQESIH
jgi:UDP-N-acetyl-D-glucosamine dehydrogenase